MINNQGNIIFKAIELDVDDDKQTEKLLWEKMINLPHAYFVGMSADFELTVSPVSNPVYPAKWTWAYLIFEIIVLSDVTVFCLDKPLSLN